LRWSPSDFFAYSFHYFSLAFVLLLLLITTLSNSLGNAALLGAAGRESAPVGNLISGPLLRYGMPAWAAIGLTWGIDGRDLWATMTILVSAFVSLTLTPVMCARFLRREHGAHRGRLFMASERVFEHLLAGYRASLDLALRHRAMTLAFFVLTVAISGYLFVIIPKGFFPQQDTGLLIGTSEAAQDVSFAEMQRRSLALNAIVMSDPDVATVGMTAGATGT
jgi:hypothetical protein